MTDPYINAIYSFFSYGITRYTGLQLRVPLPPAISVELSSVCNLACPECMTGTGEIKRKRDFMDISLAQKLAGELSSTTISSYLYFQGEPLLHPHFFEIAELFRNMNPAISTNGHYLSENNCERLASSALKKIIVSYDGVSQDTYCIYRRGGDLATVTEGIKNLNNTIRRNRSKVRIELQFLIGRHNEHEVKEAASFARSVNSAFSVKTMQVLDHSRDEIWTPANKKWSRYGPQEVTGTARALKRRGCLRMWCTSVITSDGDVVPCCYDKKAEHVMGNLNTQNFSVIWNGEKYNKYRSYVMKSRSSISLCSKCDQGKKLIFRRMVI